MTSSTREQTRDIQWSAAHVGGKAKNLRCLQRAGFPVPAFFVVPSRWFDAVVAPRRDALRRALDGVHAIDRDRIERVAADMDQWLSRHPLSEDLKRMVESGLIGLRTTRFAVRSSVRGEDSPAHSFAGLMDSLLDVETNDVPDAIVQVWKSACSPRAIAYRLHHGLTVHDISAAVVVQVMVESKTSGVAFSREPEGGGACCVVVAGQGLGDGVVSDRVATDEYRIDRHDGTIRRRCAASCPVLTDEQILRVRDLAKSIEAEMGSPQDIEWAFDAGGELCVLQTRPIVFRTPSSEAAEAPVCVWDNSNIVESYPGLTLPLTFSVARDSYAHIFRNAAKGLAPTNGVLRDDAEPAFDDLIGLVKGRVYYNLINWYTMLSYLPGFRRHQRAWDSMIGIDQPVELPVAELSRRDRQVGLLRVGWCLVANRRNVRRFFETFREMYGRHRALAIETLDDGGLVTAYEDLRHETHGFWHWTLYNDFCAMTYFELLRRWGKDWIGADGLHNDLLAAEGSIESVMPLRSLLELAAIVGGEPRLRRAVESMDDGACWTLVQTSPDLIHLRDRLALHIERYGDRVVEELKLETPTLREEPARIFGQIRQRLAVGPSPADADRDAAARRREAERTVRATLRNPLRRAAFGFVLGRCRHAIGSRENMRLARGRIYGLVRRIFREIGRRLAERGVLAEAGHVFYLTEREALDALRARDRASIASIVALRQREYESFATCDLPERFITHGADGAVLRDAEDPAPDGERLRGVGCSSGRVQAPARVVLDCRGDHEVDGHILVARSTDPAWIFLMMRAAGLVVERGSVLSHTAIVGRELGIPTVVGVRGATRRIADGDRLTIDGSTGDVSWT